MSRALQEAEVSMEAVDYDPFAGGELQCVVASTEPQREIWLADQLGRDASLSFNLSVSLRLFGKLDRRALAAALQSLVDRHESLRAVLDPQGERLCIRKPLPFVLAETDVSRLEGDARRQAIDARVRQSVEVPFDVAGDMLFRAELLCISDAEHQLVLSAHHVACDGWSWWVIVRELGALYAHHTGGVAPPLPPAQAYSTYAIVEANALDPRQQQEDEAFWLGRFADEVPVLELPTDHPRPAYRSFASARVDHVLDAELAAGLRRLGARRGASLFATLLAGFSTLLGRLAGQDKVVIGIPAAGQAAGGHETLVGHCVNTLPLRFDLDAERSFDASLDAAQDVLLDALEHQRYTFGTLLRKLPIARDPGRMPLVSVLFNIDQALESESRAFPGLELEFFDNPRRFDTFELFVNAAQVHGALRLECQYNRDLFDEATVRRWLAAYESLLRAALDDAGMASSRLPLVDAGSFAELAALQPAPVPFDRDCRMHEHFERQHDLTPERIAVRVGDVELTYAQLEARANRIAHLLRANGVRNGTLVGLSLDRDADMLAALLGVLKAGAGYVPLDPGFPAERLAYMAGDANLSALVTQRRHAGQFDLEGRPLLALDELADVLDAQSGMRIGRDDGAAQPESSAYVIYTSGSTGKPKGVQVQHRAVSNFLAGMRAEPGIGAEDRLLAVTTLSFDIAVLELMLPLCVGAQVVIADRETATDAEALSLLLRESGATMMQATPATWRLLLETDWQGGEGFSVLCGGEPMAPDLARHLLQRCGALWNLYGPTETTVWSTCTRIEPGADGAPDIHIGHPIANTQVWIVDEHGGLCPRGVPGEICIGGEGVTLGYLDRPELTADRFVPDRYDPGAREGARVYRTGDRGRWRPDGQLEHQGRLDFQVKVRGYRIELGEIEAILASHPAVAQTVVMAREDRPGDVRLVAYSVPHAGQTLDESAMAAHLRGQLPDYMIPQHLVLLPSIPLLPNGKIDRKRLPAPEARRIVEAAPRDRSPAERYLAEVWSSVLGTEVGPDDNFFDVGGHSMLAAKMAGRVQRECGVRLNLLVLASSTLGQLAEVLSQDGRFATDAAGDATSGSGDAAGSEVAGQDDVRSRAKDRPDAVPLRAEDGEVPRCEAFHFGPAGRRLFGIYHAPRGKVRGCVLLCPPLLHEHQRSYRFFAGVADELAAAGLACLRFDYFGTGDSPGASDEFRPAEAGRDIVHAAEVLRQRAGDAPLAVMGIRASAILARTEAKGLHASMLWLWQPVFDAESYLQGLASLDAEERASSARYSFSRKGPPADPNELVGFALASTFREELLALAEAPIEDEPQVVVVDAAGADSVGSGGKSIVLPAPVADWVGQVELHGLIPLRAAADAIDRLAAMLLDGD